MVAWLILRREVKLLIGCWLLCKWQVCLPFGPFPIAVPTFSVLVLLRELLLLATLLQLTMPDLPAMDDFILHSRLGHQSTQVVTHPAHLIPKRLQPLLARNLLCIDVAICGPELALRRGVCGLLCCGLVAS